MPSRIIHMDTCICQKSSGNFGGGLRKKKDFGLSAGLNSDHENVMQIDESCRRVVLFLGSPLDHLYIIFFRGKVVPHGLNSLFITLMTISPIVDLCKSKKTSTEVSMFGTFQKSPLILSTQHSHTTITCILDINLHTSIQHTHILRHSTKNLRQAQILFFVLFWRIPKKVRQHNNNNV